MTNPFNILKDYLNSLIDTEVDIYIATSAKYDEKFSHSKLTPRLTSKDYNKDAAWAKHWDDLVFTQDKAVIKGWEIDYADRYLCIVFKLEYNNNIFEDRSFDYNE